ncbi:fish-egg lectin-like isoform X3 [Thunnus maccoyii]|uniref:fish-egg lectin-like isoform X3 n=1 Tax=Thunnus maccoyii TaxID=8240 RepID=UPI001C4B4C33|nr:fish-egg lectin-like isoform X3 [Thunnus maccoyii]
MTTEGWDKLGREPAEAVWGPAAKDDIPLLECHSFIEFSALIGQLKQIDAGGDGQVVGVNSGSQTYCLRRTYASAFKGVGTTNWNSLSRTMKYYSCGPMFGCWGVDTSHRVYVTQTITPTTCGISSWSYVSGISAKMIEVSTDGSVFALTTTGQVYQRNGIYSGRRLGSSWSRIPMCLHVSHLSYDLGQLWIVSQGGIILRCTH